MINMINDINMCQPLSVMEMAVQIKTIRRIKTRNCNRNIQLMQGSRQIQVTVIDNINIFIFPILLWHFLQYESIILYCLLCWFHMRLILFCIYIDLCNNLWMYICFQITLSSCCKLCVVKTVGQNYISLLFKHVIRCVCKMFILW